MLLHGARRLLSFAFTPERAWREAALSNLPYPVMHHLGVLALVPAAVAALLTIMPGDHVAAALLTPMAYDSPFALALRNGAEALAIPITSAAERGSAVAAAGAALIAYVTTWLAVASGALILYLLMPVFSGRRDVHRCMMVVSYAATPLLLSSAALLHPSLAAIIALALIHAFYVAYLGLPAMLNVPSGDAGVCLGIAGIAALLFGQAAGYGAGTLLSFIVP